MSETTDIVQVETPPVPEVFMDEPTTPAIKRMEAEARALQTAYNMAKSLSKTSMVPQHFQQSHTPRNHREPLGDKAAQDLAAAIMYGAELGMSAMQAAQNVFTVHGSPGVYSKTMVAQVRRWIDNNGTGGPDGDGVWEVAASPERVVWAGRRDGRPAASEWTIERATTAGFTSNELYKKQPTEMLRAKAQAEVCRILFQDVLLGMSHSVEELQLSETVSVQRVSRPPAQQKGLAGLQAAIEERRQAAETTEQGPEPTQPDTSVEAAPAPEPEPAPAAAEALEAAAPDGGDDTPPPGSGKADSATIQKVRDLLTAEKYQLRTKQGMKEALEFLSQCVSQEVTDIDSLSDDQAAEVIAVLTNTEKEK
ncbi:hypothetical protein [Mycobacteroides abscessus]|uniref:hypothetical protein n=1 Tax=Mycobacteroides abscessus TaxID=36809 RepID=UPI0009A5EFBF|nr:hypothetical protein [Mycobacteroides abscessus]SKW05026.1 Uncharacterised protein [Mycobacteroides abscessus subsp. abscessus]